MTDHTTHSDDTGPEGTGPEGTGPDVTRRPTHKFAGLRTNRVTDPATSRPVNFSARLRGLSGVSEELLDRTPHERAKYTALGGVVLGTSVIAAFSMWNFATEALGRASVLAVIPTVIWMLFVLNLDRLLVSPQPNARRQTGPLVLRLLIALMLGVVIAEPLVLRIFATAVEAHVADERIDDIDRLRSNLVRCNPVPSTTATSTPEDCTSTYVLSFAATPGRQSDELAALRSDAADLQKRVDRDANRLEAIDSEVRDECRQMIRIAATGLYQRSSECLRLREKASDYRTTHHTEKNETRLAGMNNRIARIEGRLTTARGDFLEARAEGIEQRIVEERAKQKEIGVLERIRALDELAGGNTVVFVGIWMIRLLFVLLDMLPVIVKFLGRENSYDQMLTLHSNSAVKIYGEQVRLDERRALADIEIAQDSIEQEIRRNRAESEAALREHTAAMNIRVRQAVNTLEKELRRSSSV
ncbi:DUF4407 domain-containing protein [Streptomyces ortus]|uniref:DUF4407 domain-containing protein n=1 Tax=Streptomyces ortus TaxID=2867268 RepID=A0ABT3V7G1_9ACTN|nr:DUF4407 domain-containing protein [Streptomyces ortus]MCX4235793.1 DUF4407 domain-containing protein [Streptomyces ortus]